MTARHRRDDGPLGQALGDDRRLLLRRPLAPTLDARDHLDPSWMRSRRHLLGVVTTVNTMVETMPAHGGHHAPRLRLPKCGGGAPLTVGLVVTRCDAPPFFQTLDTVLYEMAPFVHLGVVGDGCFAIFL